MSKLVSGLIDVFADEALTGNPLAVVEGADALSDDVLRRIAGEFNQAETTFLMKSDRADWKLRSFTASEAEIYGAGHNALGAWLWLGDHGRLGDLDTPTTFQQEIGPDVLPIVLETREGRVHGRMGQAQLKLSDPLIECAPLLKALALTTDDLVLQPSPCVADTGAGRTPLKTAGFDAIEMIHCRCWCAGGDDGAGGLFRR